MRIRDERGQSAVLVLVFMTVLLGLSAAVLDVGSWFRDKRAAQSAADAAALAGAQALPADPAAARAAAVDYATRNGGGVLAADVTITSTKSTNDTIKVQVHRTSPAFFSKLFGLSSVNVGASAGARAFIPGETRFLAPIVVNIQHRMLTGAGCGHSGPCFGSSYPTTLPLGKTGAPGAFNLLNLNDDATGTIGASTLAQWITSGYDDLLPLRQYYSDPGAKWNNSTIQAAVNARVGTELLFPVFDNLLSSGSNAEYRVIAWVGFHLTDVVASGGDTGSISGWFTRVIWAGLEATSSSTIPDLGVRSVVLSE